MTYISYVIFQLGGFRKDPPRVTDKLYAESVLELRPVVLFHHVESDDISAVS